MNANAQSGLKMVSLMHHLFSKDICFWNQWKILMVSNTVYQRLLG